MNSVNLIGRLARDPELRYTPSGVAVTRLVIAVDRPFTNQQGEREADFIDVVVWQKQAENCANYLSKGRQIGVEGRLQIRSYEDSQGIRRKAAEVVARHVEFLGGKGDGNGGRKPQQQGGEMENNIPDGIPADINWDTEVPF